MITYREQQLVEAYENATTEELKEIALEAVKQNGREEKRLARMLSKTMIKITPEIKAQRDIEHKRVMSLVDAQEARYQIVVDSIKLDFLIMEQELKADPKTLRSDWESFYTEHKIVISNIKRALENAQQGITKLLNEGEGEWIYQEHHMRSFILGEISRDETQF